MSNPSKAYPHTRCDSCQEEVGEGNDIFFDDGEKLCEDCAREDDHICSCGNYKKSEYRECYECAQS